jgi:hypothetical protein
MQVLFHPSGSVVSAYNLRTGARILQLRGHMATINACCWCDRQGALITGSNDRNLLMWTPELKGNMVSELVGADTRSAQPAGDQDAWSEDDAENPGEGALFSGGRQVGAVMDASQRAPALARSEGWRPSRGRSLGVDGGVASLRRHGRAEHASARIRRIARRLVLALQPHMGQDPEMV